MQEFRPVTCCFTGYRAEKMPFAADDPVAVSVLAQALEQAIRKSAEDGYTRFFTGMSTGFDLWAAEAVLRLKPALGVQLLCAVPFDRQADQFPLGWKRKFNDTLLRADQVFVLSRDYYAGCFAARNRFMVEASSLVICYYDGCPGGTRQTVQLAKRSGLRIMNLADGQLVLPSL
ncbi:SLOG family protein [Agathobaculum sp.]|uniref:SLOG family protein n=1 Tax=Agathobaculum sp. TaxID=2048138 RepID=UPI002A80C570|nr:SLOG family protein [Agathobaculum sp.]MDY3617487.1 SLOG family protein [Agathobaculum sp.]